MPDYIYFLHPFRHGFFEQAANAFMMNNPSVKKNIMMAELHPLRVSLTANC